MKEYYIFDQRGEVTYVSEKLKDALLEWFNLINREVEGQKAKHFLFAGIKKDALLFQYRLNFPKHYPKYYPNFQDQPEYNQQWEPIFLNVERDSRIHTMFSQIYNKGYFRFGYYKKDKECPFAIVAARIDHHTDIPFSLEKDERNDIKLNTLNRMEEENAAAE